MIRLVSLSWEWTLRLEAFVSIQRVRGKARLGQGLWLQQFLELSQRLIIWLTLPLQFVTKHLISTTSTFSLVVSHKRVVEQACLETHSDGGKRMFHHYNSEKNSTLRGNISSSRGSKALGLTLLLLGHCNQLLSVIVVMGLAR
ncbi:hypothetical protein H5410_045959 [Solanum commersonii]|uniref:Uncharacterized protein n=1 Tax=Solanum commersonii TaxID=4109 RepID=A0A9J5XD17_SOLCO|nr:hypothetical protein H5410_045959 [Solanum commersonii]